MNCKYPPKHCSGGRFFDALFVFNFRWERRNVTSGRATLSFKKASGKKFRNQSVRQQVALSKPPDLILVTTP
jgi:hypothetical protein